jgi:hypothetical protein
MNKWALALIIFDLLMDVIEITAFAYVLMNLTKLRQSRLRLTVQCALFLLALCLGFVLTLDFYWFQFGNGKIKPIVDLSLVVGLITTVVHFDFGFFYLVRSRELHFLYRIYDLQTSRRKLCYRVLYITG